MLHLAAHGQRCQHGVNWSIHGKKSPVQCLPSPRHPNSWLEWLLSSSITNEKESSMSQKVAYVTGGMGGIGTAICQRLHKDGFKVIAGCGPTRDHAKWLGEQKALGYTFYGSVVNVGDWDSTVAAF